jgi:segregation and condensation protein B
MSEFYVRNVIEAALLAAGRPLPLAELAQLFEEGARPTNADLRTALQQLEASYEGRGIELKETAAGYRIQVRRGFASEISRLWPERPPRYSRAMLETLALIAYRQPITRGEIEAVRGVAVNPQIIKAMQERNWVRVVGVRDVPGRPELLGTTREFLDYFGLKNLDELPPLAELQAMGDFNLQLELSGTPSAVQVSNSEPAAELSAEQSESLDSSREDPVTMEEEQGDEEELSTAAQASRELVAGGRNLDH